MTRRDFELLARVLRQAQDDYEAGDEIEPATITQRLADELALTNPRFDRDSFLRASGASI